MLNVEELTFRAIPKLIEDDAEEQSVYVQVYDINLAKSGRLTSIISDGSFFIKAFFNDDGIIKAGKDNNSIICIKSHGALKNSVGITNFKLVSAYPQKVGEPSDWIKSRQSGLQNLQPKHYKLDLLKKISPQKPMPPKLVNKQISSEYETINDLHVGLQRWTILCRLVRKTLKQSPKKGMKILEIELIDKSKKKIIGTFFNESAIQFNEYLNQNSIYQISKGRLKQGNYNNSRNEMFSPYTLIFDSRTLFKQVSDVNIIAKNQDTAITLGQIYDKKIFNQQFDVIAYIFQVKEQSSIQKGDKQLRIREIMLADPEHKITMSTRLWNWNQQLDFNNKIMMLNRFVLTQYKGSISLASTSRSSITQIHDHHYKQYDAKKINTSQFVATTQARQRYEENTQNMSKNIKQLQEQISTLSEGDSIKSILHVWVNRMAVNRRWSYDACPKCKKTAENHSKCQNLNCQFLIQDTNPSFLMGVQVSDPFGSLWITAYDDLGKKIFHDMNGQIVSQLQKLSQSELQQKIENYIYQPFKLKVVTKKDHDGRIKHNAGYLYDLHEQKSARQNIDLISKLMSN